MLRKINAKQLLNRIADTASSSLALEFRILSPLTLQPRFNERLNMGGQFFPATCAAPLRKLSESEQDRHTDKNIPRSVVLIA